MRRQQRLRHRRDFDAVYRSGRSYAQGPLVLRTRANPDVAAPRFGFAVGKRLGVAVVRNRIKRRLREAVKASGARGSVDVVVIARKEANKTGRLQVAQSLLSHWIRIGEKCGK